MNNSFKALLPIVMLFMTVCLVTLPLGYQVIQVGPYVFSAVALIIPFRYLISDIISEVYGYYLAKKVIWIMLACAFLFAGILSTAIKLPAPPYWTHAEEYQFVLGGALKIAIYASLGLIAGSFLNIYLVSKWKILVRGKYFWLRSLGSSVIGELTQYIIGLTLMFYNYLEWSKLFELILADYLLQTIILCFLAPIAHIAMYQLKKFEKVEITDKVVTINPFSFKA